MTKYESAVIMAHTGVCMLTGEDFNIFHAYIEKLMGRPVQTFELAFDGISEELRQRSKDDFIKICSDIKEDK